MRIRELVLKNFKAFGPEEVKIDFSSDPELIWCTGQNGAGKSSIADGIIYALYGKNPSGRISDLPNWMNPDDMYVSIKVEANNQEVFIERGANGFNIFIDGKEYEQAGKTNMQQFLEREYFDLPYHAFKNILVLSINDFRSFLTMTPTDKRKIIDKIFGFSLINEMRKINKEYLKETKENLREIQANIEQVNKNITDSQNHLEEIKEQLDE